jgi:hypothetical protein
MGQSVEGKLLLGQQVLGRDGEIVVVVVVGGRSFLGQLW